MKADLSDSARLVYLADGAKMKTIEGDGHTVRYRGSLIYKQNTEASGDTVVGALWDEGFTELSGSWWKGWTTKDIWYVKDYLGNVRGKYDITSSFTPNNALSRELSRSDYFPYGQRVDASTNPQSTTYGTAWNDLHRRHFGGKEETGDAGLNLLDFGARYYDPYSFSWTSADPLAENSSNLNPYSFCGNNPVNYSDKNGLDWYKAVKGYSFLDYFTDKFRNISPPNTIDEPEYELLYTNAHSQEELEYLGISGTYIGNVVLVFNGSRDEKLGVKNGKSGYIDGEGAVTAEVILYGPDGEDDISYYTGYTMSSDPIKYGAIDEGTYPANYDEKGKRGKIPSHWAINNRNEIRMLDGKINPIFPHQRFPNGEGFKNGIFIHRTNNNGYAGPPVSVGCLLLTPTDFADFDKKMRDVKTFVVQLNRTK